MGGFAPAGGVVGTLRDMARLAVGLMDGSAPGSGSLTPIEGVSISGPNRASGMFWVIESDPGTNRKMIWHNGQTGGYSSFLGFAPHSGRAMIVLINVSRANEQQQIVSPAWAAILPTKSPLILMAKAWMVTRGALIAGSGSVIDR